MRVLRAAAVVGLAVVAAVHLRLADRFDVIGGAVTLGQLFRVQALAAGGLAVAVLLRPTPRVLAAATAVGLLSVAALLGTTYGTLPAVGPFPRVHEPIWYADKVAAAAAAALAAAAAGWLLVRRRSA